MISDFDNLAVVLTIKDASDLFIYLYIHFSQSGQRKLMFSIIDLKKMLEFWVILSRLQHMNKISLMVSSHLKLFTKDPSTLRLLHICTGGVF